MIVTQAKLKEALSYNVETGVFTWNISKVGVKKGSRAECAGRGYVLIRINDQLYRAHRLVWLYVYGVWPNTIDHINHDRRVL